MKRFLAMLLAVMLVVGLLPTSVMAGFSFPFGGETSETPRGGETNAASTSSVPKANTRLSAVQEQNEEGTGKVSVTLKGLHETQINAMKLYTYDTDSQEIGKTDLLAGVQQANNTYTVELEPGHYWVEGFSTYNEQTYDNGGLSIEVSETNKEFTVYRIYKFGVSYAGAPAGGLKQGTDYTVAVELTDASGKKVRDAKMGQTVYSAGESVSCIFVNGDTIKATFTAQGELAKTYEQPKVASVKKTFNAQIDNLYFEAAHKITVTAPKGSTVTAGRLCQYYTYEFSEMAEGSQKVDDEAGTVTADYYVKNAHGYLYGDSEYHFVRVQHPDGVTYWKFGLWNQSGQQVTVTADEVKIGQNYDPKTVVRGFTNNRYDTGNIYLSLSGNSTTAKTAGAAGAVYLRRGGNTVVNVWRNWQAKDTYWPTQVALPDVHYTVLNAETGKEYTESETPLITITEAANNSSQATVQGGSPVGAAIVLVTYDAVTHPNAMARKGTEEVTFSAIWPENTGVFVVDVSQSEATPKLATMTLPYLKQGSEGMTQTLDSELDVIYYTGEAGASYTFELNDAAYTVSVARSSIVDGKMTFNGFDSTTGISQNGTSVTVSGLTEGRHIIKVSNGTSNQYQVITTKKAGYTVTHANGTAVTAENPAAVGETVTIQYENLYNPMEHLAGVYNNAPGIYLRGSDNSYFNNDLSMLGGYYDFSADSSRQKLTVTIPVDVTESAYTLEGCLHLVGFGDSKGGHRTHKYTTSVPSQSGGGNSPNSNEYLCYLPVVSIPVTPATALDVTMEFKAGDKAFKVTDLTTISIKNRNGRELRDKLQDDGSLKCVVGEYTYDISGVGIKHSTGSFTVSKAGTVTINLVESSTTAWDGTTKTEPGKNGAVYQISTGNELAWFVEKSQALNAGESLSGVLTADIDLAEYVWLSAYTSGAEKTAGATTLNGQGHAVRGLNSAVGLFAYLGKGSKISNLTVKGQVEYIGNKSGFSGGIAATVHGTTIENCVNEAIVHGERYAAGGIVGGAINDTTATAESKIIGCVNRGAVSGGAYSGGIVGSAIGSCVTVESCYSTAAVSGETYAGGIVGQISGVSASAMATVKYCYTTQAKLVGNSLTNVQISDCACLGDGTDSTDGVMFCSAEELKGFAPAGSKLVLPCAGGYPAVEWEMESGKYHVSSEAGTVTAPTCTAKGYTTHTCSNCTKSYKTAYVNALGHTMTETVVKDYPAYTMNQCERFDACGVTLKKWKNEAFSYMTLPDSGVKDLTYSGDWTYSDTNKRFEAGNQATESKTATFTFTVEKAAVVELDYGCYKVTGWFGNTTDSDTATYKLEKTGAEEAILDDTLASSTTKSLKKALDAGTYTLTLTYNYANGGKNNSYGYVTALGLTCYDTTEDAEQGLNDYNAAKPVMDKISAIGTVTLKSEASITAARTAYNALTEAQKAYVTNYATLTAAEKKLADLKKAEAEEKEATVKVTFRLIGSTICENEDGVDLSLGLDGFYGVTYQTWIKTTTYTLPKGATCYDLFEQALEDAGLTYEGAKNWVSGIRAPKVLGGYMLSQLENGRGSGWMYTVNGSHVNQTMDQYVLKSGDKIIWHYVNDYSYEQKDTYGGSQGDSTLWNLWLKAPDRNPGESDRIDSGKTEDKTEDTVTTVNPSATANKNGEATANLGSGTMKDAISDAKNDGSSAIVIEPEIKGDASKVTVNVPVSSAASVGKDAGADLTLKTDVGTITLPAEELKSLSGSGNLTISAAKKENGEVEVNITKGGEDVTMKNVSVTVPAENGKTNTVLVLVHEDGTEEVLKKSIVTENGVTGLVDGSCTVKAVEKTTDFGDTTNHWAKDSAEFVANRGIFNGTGEKEFSPDLPMNRAMVATVLHRLENAPKANDKTNYTDKLDAWAEEGIAWATENEIVTGYAGQFNGDRPVTRQELATMLYRYAKVLGLSTDSKGDLSKFSDGASTAEWAQEAMAWAVGEQLFTGRTATTLDPTGTATRAEVAVVTERLVKLMVK